MRQSLLDTTMHQFRNLHLSKAISYQPGQQRNQQMQHIDQCVNGSLEFQASLQMLCTYQLNHCLTCDRYTIVSCLNETNIETCYVKMLEFHNHH